MNAKLGLNSFNSFAKTNVKSSQKGKSIKNTIAKSSQASTDNPETTAEGGESSETTDLTKKDTSVNGGEYATAGEKTDEKTSIFLNEEEAAEFRKQLERQNLINEYDYLSALRQAEYAGQDQDRLLANQQQEAFQRRQQAALGFQVASALGNIGLGALRDVAGAAKSIKDKKAANSGTAAEECEHCNGQHGNSTHTLAQKDKKAFEGMEGTIPVDAKGNPILLDEHGQPMSAQHIAHNDTNNGNQPQRESIDGQIYTDPQDHDSSAYGGDAFEVLAMESEQHQVDAPDYEEPEYEEDDSGEVVG